MTDLATIARALEALCTVVHGDVYRVLSRAESLIAEAREVLAEFDDPAARTAHQHATTALDQVRNARYGFLDQFVRQGTALSTRLDQF
ncbi:hypothetical protein [Granulicoccus sp. GXG6511]|uniref:hypothetical protein n=1 Tax=Granulicoccus sp. GXG6511 TaxID=3381351 RepID=UPI003D7C5DBF